MTVHGPLTTDAMLAAFDEHLRRTRGVCPEVRHTYARFVRAFLEKVFAGGPVDPERIGVHDIVEFVTAMTVRYRPPTVQLVATALRSFFRFLRAQGLRDDRLEEAVPMVAHRRLTCLPRHLDGAQFARLIASLDASSPVGLRDRAILLCVARLGLRASEVARLRVDDIDWRGGVVHVHTRKTGAARSCRCHTTWDKPWPRTCGGAARSPEHGRYSSCTTCGSARRSVVRSSETPFAGR